MAKKGTLSRRSFLTTVAGTAALAGATSVVTGSAQAQNYTGNTDSDTGSYADRAGYGRTGYTDSDGGSNADRAGYGRGGGRTGITDSDSGSYADAAGNGRGSSGVTDSDPNDPVGNGRGGRRSGQTDSDTGSYADPVGNGRGSSNYTDSDSGGCAEATQPRLASVSRTSWARKVIRLTT